MIGVFDSGVGGLTVLKAIRARAPKADIVYFGDTENVPYGNKNKREIGELIGMALRRLHVEGITDVVSACNSASVSVMDVPIDLLRLNIFNVIEMTGPTAGALSSMQKPIVLFGTAATVRSGIYERVCEEEGFHIESIAIPELAGLIEKGAPLSEQKEAIAPAVREALHHGAKTLSLSCTHFPFAKELFEMCVREEGGGAVVFDPSDAVAEEVERRFTLGGGGTMRFLISAPSDAFEGYVRALFEPGTYTIEIAPPIYHSLGTL